MIRRERRPAGAPGADPVRLLRSRTAAADLLKNYAKRTQPGERADVAAWYRLRSGLEAPGAGAGAAPALGRWLRTHRFGGAFAAALGLWLVVRLAASPGAAVDGGPVSGQTAGGPPAVEARGGLGLGGAPGSFRRGQGGMEGIERQHRPGIFRSRFLTMRDRSGAAARCSLLPWDSGVDHRRSARLQRIDGRHHEEPFRFESPAAARDTTAPPRRLLCLAGGGAIAGART